MRFQHTSPYAVRLRHNEDVCLRTYKRISTAKPERKPPQPRYAIGRILRPVTGNA